MEVWYLKIPLSVPLCCCFYMFCLKPGESVSAAAHWVSFHCLGTCSDWQRAGIGGARGILTQSCNYWTACGDIFVPDELGGAPHFSQWNIYGRLSFTNYVLPPSREQISRERLMCCWPTLRYCLTVTWVRSNSCSSHDKGETVCLQSGRISTYGCF